MTTRHYLRPTAFVDAPFGHDGKVARLAGGLLWFSAVEVATLAGDRLEAVELVPVGEAGDRAAALGPEAEAAWRRLLAPRAPLALGARMVRLAPPPHRRHPHRDARQLLGRRPLRRAGRSGRRRLRDGPGRRRHRRRRRRIDPAGRQAG